MKTKLFIKNPTGLPSENFSILYFEKRSNTNKENFLKMQILKFQWKDDTLKLKREK